VNRIACCACAHCALVTHRACDALNRIKTSAVAGQATEVFTDDNGN
jgi:hypothetical protein